MVCNCSWVSHGRRRWSKNCAMSVGVGGGAFPVEVRLYKLALNWLNWLAMSLGLVRRVRVGEVRYEILVCTKRCLSCFARPAPGLLR